MQRAAETGDETAFLRLDREFSVLCPAAARKELAEPAMSLMHGLSRRVRYSHHREFGQMPMRAGLHADVARVIAEGDAAAAAVVSDGLSDFLEDFTRTTVSASK